MEKLGRILKQNSYKRRRSRPGFVMRYRRCNGLLAERCLQVFGLDHDPELFQAAKQQRNLSNIEFIVSSVSQNLPISLLKVDGIWCSFTAAYFPNFKPVLSTWMQQLKPGGWMRVTHPYMNGIKWLPEIIIKFNNKTF